jgi:Peptidase family M1 domain
MYRMNRLTLYIIFLLSVAAPSLLPQFARAQERSAAEKAAMGKPAYNQLEVFDPLFFTNNGNEFRTASGEPGPKYWQNSASYLIHAALDEQDTSVKGDVAITYTNNSPNSLNYMWLQLDQNLFSPDSRGAAATPVSGDRFDVKGYKKGGYHIASVSVVYKGVLQLITPVITDTRMQIRLPFSVRPGGDKIIIKVNYSFSIPQYGADRMGRAATKNGTIYQLAQWYPRMCVYDDVEGWNTLPYMGQGEFYCDYGNFDYYITAPAGMTVVGSGDLQNPEQTMTPVQQQRLARAYASDSTVTIIGEDEVATPASHLKPGGVLTWHFKMQNSRDISWAASTAFIWDAARVKLPSGLKTIAMSVYPVESNGYDAYGRATQYLKHSIEFYSKTYFEYPWRSAVTVAGVALGMEYPGIIFTSYKIGKSNLWADVTHEIGHNWFPMIVGSNERRYMWMDEGFNTFINGYASAYYNHGEYGDSTRRPASSMARVMLRSKDPLMTPPEVMSFRDVGLYYNKTAVALNILRSEILGPERFDYAFRTYVSRWAFKHPQPDDFFRTMNDAAGDDLAWFWKEWFFTVWTLDQAIEGVKYVNNDSTQGIVVTLKNLGQMALPVSLKITEENGHSEWIKLPVEIWQRGDEWVFKYNSTSPVSSIVLDPDNRLPDTDRSNNRWEPKK